MPNSSSRMPTFFLSHGGGPWPWMDEMADVMQVLAQSLQELPASLPARPKAILMVTAHWEEAEFTVSSSPQPGMVYDYGGFPAHTYQVSYPAAGAVSIIPRLRDLMQQSGFALQTDPHRGYDHGTFVPLAVAFPDADVPVLQMSLKRGLSPADHIALGRALAPFRDEGVLILGSGLSFHNLRIFFSPSAREPSASFDAWLGQTMQATPSERVQRLIEWQSAPAARLCHPREEHLLPLMVVVGAGESDAATCVYHEDQMMGCISVSSYRLG